MSLNTKSGYLIFLLFNLVDTYSSFYSRYDGFNESAQNKINSNEDALQSFLKDVKKRKRKREKRESESENVKTDKDEIAIKEGTINNVGQNEETSDKPKIKRKKKRQT